jgi:hypothetical protein
MKQWAPSKSPASVGDLKNFLSPLLWRGLGEANRFVPRNDGFKIYQPCNYL